MTVTLAAGCGGSVVDARGSGGEGGSPGAGGGGAGAGSAQGGESPGTGGSGGEWQSQAQKLFDYGLTEPRYLTMSDEAVFVANAVLHVEPDRIQRFSKVDGAPTAFTDNLYDIGALAVRGDELLVRTHLTKPSQYNNQDYPTVAVLDEQDRSIWGFVDLGDESTHNLAAGQKGFYVSENATGELLRFSLDFLEEPPPPEVVVPSFVAPAELQADDSGVYFMSSGDGTLRRLSEADDTVEIVAQPEEGWRNIRVKKGVACWLTGHEPTTVRCSVDGVPATVMTTANTAARVTMNDTHVFVITDPSQNSPDFPYGELWTAPLGGGQPALLAEHLAKASEVEADNSHVYWLTQGVGDEEAALWRMPVLK